MDEDAEYMKDKKCVKCPEPAKYAGVDVKKAVYCRPCFITMVSNKFRTALTKRKIFKDDEERDCLVIFDGSSSSCLLLHLIANALNVEIYNRLKINPIIVILVSSLEETNINIVIERAKNVKTVIPSAPLIIVHLAACLAKKKITLNESCQGIEKVPLLQKLLEGCRTPTSKEELLRILREKTCALVAKSLEAKKVMLSDDSDKLGRLTLSQLCLGRGGIVSEMTSVLEKRSNGISYIRPLRELSAKEVAIVNHLEGYDKSSIRTNENIGFMQNSIQAATSIFVDNLIDEGFKSTNYSVISTASKLHILSAVKVCPFCEIGNIEAKDICSCCSSLMEEIENPEFLKESLL